MEIKQLEEKVGAIVEGTMEKILPSLIEKSIEERLEEKMKDFEKFEKGFLKRGKNGKEDEPEVEGKANVAKFVKAVATKDVDALKEFQKKAMTEGTNSQGGYAVPEEFRAEVVRLAEDFGLVRSLARVIPMKRDTLNMPKVTSSVTVYWPGEGVAGTASQPVFGQVQLTAKTAIGLTVLSNELLEDAEVDMVDLLMELFAEALAGEEDKQGLVGTGSPFTGILSDSSVTVVTMGTGDTAFSNVTADDLRDMISQLKPLALAGAGFVMHRASWGIVQKLKDDNNQYICTLANPITTGDASKATGIVGYVWGIPVRLSEKMPSTSADDTKFIALGNLKYMYFGDRKQMTMKVSEDATVGSSNTFEQNMSAVRVTERIAIAIGLPTAFVVLKTAASA